MNLLNLYKKIRSLQRRVFRGYLQFLLENIIIYL